MIAIWMCYSLALGALIVLLATLAEQFARAKRWPTRLIWIGAIGAMTLVPLATMRTSVPMENRAGATSTLSADASSAGSRVAPSSLVAASQLTRRSPWQRTRVQLVAAEHWLTQRTSDWSRWNTALAAAWLLMSTLMAFTMVAVAWKDHRLRRTLTSRCIDGTDVLLADSLGPAVIGPAAPSIVLPRWALELDASLLRLVVRHEREHLLARDPMLLLVGLGAVVLAPWHIPLWWSWRRLRQSIEIDCDTRVLRAFPDVRRYAQLLLLVAQRSPSWTCAPLMSTMAPLRPQSSQLAGRIHAMTMLSASGSALRSALSLIGIVISGVAAYAMPRPPALQFAAMTAPAASKTDPIAPSVPTPHRATTPSGVYRVTAPSTAHRAIAPSTTTATPRTVQPRVTIRITSVGMAHVPTDERGVMIGEIRIFSPGAARVGIGDRAPEPLTDTLRLKALPEMTLDLTDADVHVMLVGGGRMTLVGEVQGGPALRLSATHDHIVFMKGGYGVHGQ